MSLKTDFAGQYSSSQDEILVLEGDRSSSIILLLKGKIDVFLSPFDDINSSSQSILSRSCRLFTLEQNTFLSVNDILRNGQNSFTLKAREACNLYCFPATTLASVKNMISNQKDYAAYIVSSLATLIDFTYTSYQKLLPICRNIDALTRNLLIYYWAVKDKYYFKHSPDIDLLNEYQKIYEDVKQDNYKFFPFDTDSQLTQYIHDNTADNSSELDTSLVEYFTRLLNVPLEQRKGFFSSDEYICEYHIQKGSEILDVLVGEIKNIFSDLCKNMEYLYLSKNNLIATYGKICTDSRDDKEAARTILNILTQTIEIIVQNINKLQNEFDCFIEINNDELTKFLGTIRSKADVVQVSAKSGIEFSGSELPMELENSLEKILQYCSYSQDKIDSFNKRLCQFRALRDKTSTDPDVRELRSSITAEFFDIYADAFKRTQIDNNCPKYISMFLNFGYMDERLLTKEQSIALYRLCDKEYSTDFTIYNTKSWLEEIYHGKKETSINDFGLDYFDVFRELKKRKAVTDNDKAAYDRDFNAKVKFEINNMLKTNQKVCHGHMSSYFPILHKDIITRDLERSIVSPTVIQQILQNLMSVDFSIFYREIWYKNDRRGIEKEPIMKEVWPDIIIVPTFGSRASMWQEITGKARNTPGRFILPAFTDENIYEMMLKLVGAFRWELCRTMMGISWNDITEKSLTSEYTDYIQFFKKNHDLTEDAKEKIKVQIQKHRNVMREIFTSDYETWINYESKGILRLNKIARSILFRYCPLTLEMRNALAKQPVFSDLLMQLNNSRAKTAKSLESKYSKMFKGDPVDRDMELNLIYYRDL